MENVTESSWTTYRYFEYTFNFVLITLYILCFLVNLLTLAAVVKFENLHRKPTNILIFSLVVADGILGLYFCLCISFSFPCFFSLLEDRTEMLTALFVTYFDIICSSNAKSLGQNLKIQTFPIMIYQIYQTKQKHWTFSR